MSKKDLAVRKTSSLKLKKQNSSINSKPKPSRVPSAYVEKNEDYFVSFLKRTWNNLSCEKLPVINTTILTHKVKTSIPTDITIGYDESGQNAIALFCRHYNLPEPGMKSLQSTFEYFLTITTLKFEFCNLSYESVAVLSLILKDNTSITYLSVNGNRVINESCDLLFQMNNVTYMSMKLCSIDSLGIRKISGELCNTNLNVLIHLNLASNLLFDECIPVVANILKVNRSLVSINLADNKITDVGCKELFTVLQRFKLSHDNIVIRRSRRLQYFIKQTEMMQHYNIYNLPKTYAQVTEPEPRKTARKSKDLQGSKGLGKKVSKMQDNTIKTYQSEDISQTMKQINMELGEDMHPFVKDSWEENKEIYCRGNFKLLHMNLSYNRITHDGLASILEALKYQKEHRKGEYCGLVKLSLEGNLFDHDCREMRGIELLMTQIERSSRCSISQSRDNASALNIGNKKRHSSRKSL